jgi:hypothetical protein
MKELSDLTWESDAQVVIRKLKRHIANNNKDDARDCIIAA